MDTTNDKVKFYIFSPPEEYRGATPLMMMVWRMDDIDLVRLLIHQGANNPYVSPDGKYLFFNSGRNGNYDIYWVDAKIIEELKSKVFE